MTNQTLVERETEVLIGIAQDKTKPAHTRLGAAKWLWNIHGEYYLGLMAAKSRAMNSDRSLQGLCDSERGVRISGQVFQVFWNVVQNFDLTRGVNFLAHLTNMGKFSLKTDKRENSKTSKRKVFIDFAQESRTIKLSKDPEKNEEAKMSAIINEIASRNSFEKDIYHCLAIEAIKRAVSDRKRLRDYLSVADKVCRESSKGYTDTEVAERMNVTKAQVGIYRRQVLELIESSRVLDKFPGPLAA